MPLYMNIYVYEDFHTQVYTALSDVNTHELKPLDNSKQALLLVVKLKLQRDQPLQRRLQSVNHLHLALEGFV